MHPSSSSRSGAVFSRVVLPLVLFVAVVGGIAWVTQYLPRGTRSTKPNGVEAANAEPLLRFSSEQAVFDKDDPDYGQEIETNEEGHYDFAFENVSGKELELGLQFKNCGCTQVEAKVGSESFKPMVQSDKESDSQPVGVGSSGVVRFNWKGKQVGPAQRLWASLWCQDKGVAKTRKFQKLEAKINVVPPLMFQPDKEDLGAVSDRTLHFICWSATRKNPQLMLKDDADPCFAYAIRPMTDDEVKNLREKLKAAKTRVQSAFHVDVAISQEKAGHFLDQGYLERKATLVVHDDADNRPPAEIAGPTIKGIVSGPVVVGIPEDNGKFKLGEFTDGDDVKRAITLSTDGNVGLKLQDQYPDVKNMNATLTKVVADSTPDRTIWSLEIDIAKSSFGGSVPDKAVIMLQTSQNRRVRIPVVGTVRVPR